MSIWEIWIGRKKLRFNFNSFLFWVKGFKPDLNHPVAFSMRYRLLPLVSVCSWHPKIDTIYAWITAQKMKFSIKDFFSKCDQIRRKLRIWSHLLKKSLIENFIFCAVSYASLDCYLKVRSTEYNICKSK